MEFKLREREGTFLVLWGLDWTVTVGADGAEGSGDAC